jgi:hypothetical protein
VREKLTGKNKQNIKIVPKKETKKGRKKKPKNTREGSNVNLKKQTYGENPWHLRRRKKG